MWDGWSLARGIHLITGIAFIAVAAQAYLLHSRQNFRVSIMWLPVIGGAAFGLIELATTAARTPFLDRVGVWAMWAGVGAGLLGTYRHFIGVGQRVGGYESQNFLVGPPVILPLIVTVLSIFGLAAYYLGGR